MPLQLHLELLDQAMQIKSKFNIFMIEIKKNEKKNVNQNNEFRIY